MLHGYNGMTPEIGILIGTESPDGYLVPKQIPDGVVGMRSTSNSQKTLLSVEPCGPTGTCYWPLVLVPRPHTTWGLLVSSQSNV